MNDSPRHASHLLAQPKVLAWAMYDWANSAYTTLMITVLVAYIQRVVFPTDQWGTTGAVIWAWGISLSMLVGALLAPVVGAMADARGNKREWLGVTALTGSACGIAIGLVPATNYVLVVALFLAANLMLELSLGIYDGFLPEIVGEDDVAKASAWGYGLGYVGGGIALLIAMLFLAFGERICLSTVASRLQASLVLMGAWWGIFTLPAIIVLRDSSPGSLSQPADDLPEASSLDLITKSARDVGSTIRDLKTNVPLAFFLLSFLFFNDGVQTVISQASTFALQELSFDEAGLMAVILMIQFLAFPGALAIAWIATKFGEKTTLMGCIAVWSLVLFVALRIQTQAEFWMLAAVIAIVLGGTQAVSRAIMSRMIPEGENAKYFGFFHLSGKATSFLGPFLFGAIVAFTGSSRLAIFGLLPLFLIGGWLLLRVKLERKALETVRNPKRVC
ncbi:MFS transporter [Roseiconus lacunae]|uniref:MFS transporter n=1 Tax=Roseiconus lacunae TaxID=2605694 RepID=UPI003092A03B|nr:MFS transporter [Stieleria sp. HD01]